MRWSEGRWRSGRTRPTRTARRPSGRAWARSSLSRWCAPTSIRRRSRVLLWSRTPGSRSRPSQAPRRSAWAPSGRGCPPRCWIAAGFRSRFRSARAQNRSTWRRRLRSRCSGYARVPRRRSRAATRFMAKPSEIPMIDQIEEIRKEATDAIGSAASTAELEDIRVRYLGRKAELTQILRGIAELPRDERGPVGKAGNEARRLLEALLESRGAELDARELGTRLAEDAIDVTLPGTPPLPAGALNPLIRTQREIEDIFVGLGYRVMEGPEVELDYYNFTALNHPPGHPARMEQDTFYVDPATLRSDLRIASNGDEIPPRPEDVVLRT